jgi:uncharacterized membrane protein YdjX (TVP38/TMEM64 family)
MCAVPVDPSRDSSIEPPKRRTRTLLPLAVLIVVFAAAIAFRADRYLSVAELARHRAELGALVAARPIVTAVGFVAFYALVVACSIPGAAVLSLTAGFLFGPAVGSICVLIGATTGAVALFLAARTAFRETFRRRAGPWLARFEAGLQRDAFAYILALRLVPAFPFWLVNLVPAFFDVRVATFALATAIGIVPGTVIFVGIGDGLGAVIDAGGTPDLGVIFQPRVLLPLLGLAALSLGTALWRRYRKRRD